MVSIEESLPCAILDGIAVGLGIDTGMVALRKALGMTITSRIAAGIGCGDDRSAVTSDTERTHIPEQSKASRIPQEIETGRS